MACCVAVCTACLSCHTLATPMPWNPVVVVLVVVVAVVVVRGATMA